MIEHLHDYAMIYNSVEATVEVCQKQGCHNRVVFRKGTDGQYNFREFYQEHKRDYLQPWMKEFWKEYGIPYEKKA